MNSYNETKLIKWQKSGRFQRKDSLQVKRKASVIGFSGIVGVLKQNLSDYLPNLSGFRQVSRIRVLFRGQAQHMACRPTQNTGEPEPLFILICFKLEYLRKYKIFFIYSLTFKFAQCIIKYIVIDINIETIFIFKHKRSCLK